MKTCVAEDKTVFRVSRKTTKFKTNNVCRIAQTNSTFPPWVDVISSARVKTTKRIRSGHPPPPAGSTAYPYCYDGQKIHFVCDVVEPFLNFIFQTTHDQLCWFFFRVCHEHNVLTIITLSVKEKRTMRARSLLRTNLMTHSKLYIYMYVCTYVCINLCVCVCVCTNTLLCVYYKYERLSERKGKKSKINNDLLNSSFDIVGAINRPPGRPRRAHTRCT